MGVLAMSDDAVLQRVLGELRAGCVTEVPLSLLFDGVDVISDSEGDRDPGDVQPLIESLRVSGQVTPIVVAEGSAVGPPLLVVAGRRRLFAAQRIYDVNDPIPHVSFGYIRAVLVSEDQRDGGHVGIAENLARRELTCADWGRIAQRETKDDFKRLYPGGPLNAAPAWEAFRELPAQCARLQGATPSKLVALNLLRRAWIEAKQYPMWASYLEDLLSGVIKLGTRAEIWAKRREGENDLFGSGAHEIPSDDAARGTVVRVRGCLPAGSSVMLASGRTGQGLTVQGSREALDWLEKRLGGATVPVPKPEPVPVKEAAVARVKKSAVKESNGGAKSKRTGGTGSGPAGGGGARTPGKRGSKRVARNPRG